MKGHKAPDKPIVKIISHWGEDTLEYSLVIVLPLRGIKEIAEIYAPLNKIVRRELKKFPKQSVALQLKETMGIGYTKIARKLDFVNPEDSGRDRVKKEIKRAMQRGIWRIGPSFTCPALDCIGIEMLPPDRPIPRPGKRPPNPPKSTKELIEFLKEHLKR